MLRTIPFLFVFALLGCKRGREAEVVGTWKASHGATLELTSDGGSLETAGTLLIVRGSWTLDGDTVTVMPRTYDGVPVATFKERIQRRHPHPTGVVANLIHDVDMPNVYTLGADGKTMKTDKTKDRNSGSGETLAKTSASGGAK